MSLVTCVANRLHPCDVCATRLVPTMAAISADAIALCSINLASKTIDLEATARLCAEDSTVILKCKIVNTTTLLVLTHVSSSFELNATVLLRTAGVSLFEVYRTVTLSGTEREF